VLGFGHSSSSSSLLSRLGVHCRVVLGSGHSSSRLECGVECMLPCCLQLSTVLGIFQFWQYQGMVMQADALAIWCTL
jgi:hypothetical protein